jgi:Protein kinase domain/Ankyrin repeats (3 copies)
VEVTSIPTELIIAHPDTEQETHYQIVGILGEGGSGTTYQAGIVGTETSVALKQLSLKQVDDWKSIELFEREAKILSKLNHPGIPAYIDYFTIDTPTDRHFYIAQALAPGKTLSDWSESGKRYTEAEIKDIAVKVLRILRYLQKIKPPVIHRDIKPSNILRTADGQISLVDFGAVRQAYHDTFLRGSTVVGTFGYMAPEQFRAQAVPSTDLYGLGATILTLLTNRSPAELTQSNLKISFRDKIQVVPAFADWLERMLEPDPIDRFDSATTALTALRNPKSLTPKLSWRKLAAISLATGIMIGVVDNYKYYFLNLWGFTPVEAFTAIWKENDVDKLKSLLDRGVSPNAKDARGSSLIYHAVTNNKVDIVKLLIDRGADIHSRYQYGEHTVLHIAVLYQDGEITKLLLDNKANPNVRDAYDYTPLHTSILREKTPYLFVESFRGFNDIKNKVAASKSINYLLAYGADINAIGGRRAGRIYPQSTDISGISGDYGTALEFTLLSPKGYDPAAIFPKKLRQSRHLEAQNILKNAGGKYYPCEDDGYDKPKKCVFKNDPPTTN